MHTGHVDSFDHRCVVGWAADTDRPNARLELRILVNGAEHGRIIADRPRDGLRQHGTYGDGAHAFSHAFDPPLSPLHAYDVVVSFVDSPAEVPAGRFRIQPTNRQDLALRPLLVTATGRSGTTLLMRRLGNAREIVIAENYPFEMKLLTYYGYALEVLTTASNVKTPISLDELTTDPHRLGLNPFHHPQMEPVYPNPALLYQFFGRRAMARLHPAFRDIIDDFYRDMQTYARKPLARFFAEKCDVFTSARDFARLAFPGVKELLLVRDPRDVHCSRRAFWSDSAENSVQNLKTVQAIVLPIRDAGSHDLHVVRYEDLVQQPAETLSRISSYLGLDHGIELKPVIESQIFASHATSPDPPSSIGRWKHELSAEERASFAQSFKPFLEAFGYDTDAS
jgi:Sulfotransferase family